MRQVGFELKKLWVRYAFIIVGVVAVMMSFFTLQTMESPRTFTPATEYVYTNPSFTLYDEEILPYYLIPPEYLTTEQQQMLSDFEHAQNSLGQLSRFSSPLTLDENRDYVQAQHDILNTFSSFIEKYQIELSEDNQQGLAWRNFETSYLLERDLVYEEGGLTPITASIMFRYGGSLLFGIVPLIVLLLVTSQSMPSEYQSSTINNHYLQPISRRRLIFSKLLAFMILAVFYFLISCLSVLCLSFVFGAGLGNFQQPLRLVGYGVEFMTVLQFLATTFIVFMSLCLLFFIFSLCLGILIRSPIQTSLLVVFVMLIGYGLSQNNTSWQVWGNPFYCFNYRELILGNRVINSNNMSGVLLVASKMKSLIVILGLSLILLVMALVFQKIEVNFFSKEKKDSSIKLPETPFFFEVQKVSQSISFKFAFGIMAAVILILFSQVVMDDNFRIDYHFGDETQGVHFNHVESINDWQERIEKINLKLDDPNLSVEEIEIAELELEQNKLYLESSEKDYKTYLRRKRNFEEGDTEAYYRSVSRLVDVAFNRHVPEEVYGHLFGEFVLGEPSEFTYQTSQAMAQLLVERDIVPIVSFEMNLTAYDKFISTPAKQSFTRWYTPSIMTGLNSLERLSDTFHIDFILIMSVIFLFGAGFVLEKEDGDHLGFLLTQPRSRLTLIIQKIMAASIVGVVFVGLLLLFLFILGTVRGGIGNWDYPILQYKTILANPMDANYIVDSYQFLNLGTYWLKSLVISILAVIFGLSISHFLSFFFKNRVALFTVVFIILGLGYLLASNGLIESIAAFLPTTYVLPTRIVDGTMMVLANTDQIGFGLGIVVLLVWSILFTGLSLLYSRFQELIN